MTPEQAVTASSTTTRSTRASCKPFDESGIWDPGMDPVSAEPGRGGATGARARRRSR